MPSTMSVKSLLVVGFHTRTHTLTSLFAKTSAWGLKTQTKPTTKIGGGGGRKVFFPIIFFFVNLPGF